MVGLEGGEASWRDFSFSEVPAEAEWFGGVQQRTSPQVAGALELPASSPLLQQWVESRPGWF